MFDFLERILSRKYVKKIVVFFFCFYLFSMFISPLFFNSCNGFQLNCRLDNFMDTLWNWQTFNASLIAFVASLFAIYSTKIAEREIRYKKRAAQLAFLPFSLADLSSYIEGVIELLKKHDRLKSDSSEMPKMPLNALNRIEKFIEFSGEKDKLFIEHLLIITRVVQVYDSRINSLSNDIEKKRITNIEEYTNGMTKQCIKFYCLVNGMYSFARSEVDNYDITSLNGGKLWANELTTEPYFKASECEEIAKQAITLELFCK